MEILIALIMVKIIFKWLLKKKAINWSYPSTYEVTVGTTGKKMGTCKKNLNSIKAR